MRIKSKLLTAFALIGFFLPVYAIVNYFYLSSFQDVVRIIVESDARVMDASADLSFLLSRIDDETEDALFANDPKQKLIAINFIKNAIPQLNEALVRWKEALHLELDDPNTEPEIVAKIKQNLVEFDAIEQQVKAYVNHNIMYLQDASAQHIPTLRNELDLRSEIVNIQKSINNLRDEYEEDLADDEIDINHSIKVTKEVGSGLILIGFLLVFLTAIAIARSITKRLSKLEEAALAITNKDYSVRIYDDYNDELSIVANSFNAMAASIQVSNQYVENILNTMPNIFILTSKDLKIRRINQTTRELLGYSEEELLNNSLLNIMYNELGENIQDNLNYPNKRIFLTKNGKEIPALVASSDLRFEGQEPDEKIFIAQDIVQLESTEKKLIVAARQAGMADIATNVLHNVGNVLNSINTSAIMLMEKLSVSNMDSLEKLADLLKQHQDDMQQFLTHNEKGKTIPKYLIRLGEHWPEEKKYLLSELNSLKRKIEHIYLIISTEQSLSKTSGMQEITSIEELINDALAINIASLDADIEIIRDFKPIKKVIIDKIKLMQIMVNLVKNALDALAATKNKCLKISVYQKDEDSFVIQVKDNGAGIPPENAEKIFSQGFTTKKKGHGFGLHSSAIAAKEIGGSLSMYSEGVGKGAVFTLELPSHLKAKKAQVI